MIKENDSKIFKDNIVPNCTSHCVGQCVPACTGGGHCVANVSTSRRPTRKDMLKWLNMEHQSTNYI